MAALKGPPYDGVDAGHAAHASAPAPRFSRTSGWISDARRTARYDAASARADSTSALAAMTIQSVDSTPYTNAAIRFWSTHAPSVPAATAAAAASAVSRSTERCIRLHDEADRRSRSAFHVRNEDFRRGVGGQARAADRTDDADDRQPRILRIRGAALDSPSEDRFAGEVLADERVIDDRHV